MLKYNDLYFFNKFNNLKYDFEFNYFNLFKVKNSSIFSYIYYLGKINFFILTKIILYSPRVLLKVKKFFFFFLLVDYSLLKFFLKKKNSLSAFFFIYIF